MPRLVPISDSEAPALLALRRTLWQLAFVGTAMAVTIARIAPESVALASWCVLVPLSALAVHFRQTLMNVLLATRYASVDQAASHRAQRPQARRARGAALPNKRRSPHARSQTQGRLPRDPARIGPQTG